MQQYNVFRMPLPSSSEKVTARLLPSGANAADALPFLVPCRKRTDPSRAMAAWLWNNRVAAVATDSPAVEPLPMDFMDEGLLHYRALPLLGLPLGELFILAPLAKDCAEDGRYEFMLVSAPLHVEGGVASPPNAVAIK